ncbi:MAG TPA: hypothetical protein VMG74_11180 [Gaiellaceae bacterium]|nr:hypothetical protein [Gaiellaceae bacterium]
MATDRPLEPAPTIEHGTTKSGRWLRARRTRIVLWIAVLEGILVAFTEDFTKWTVVAIAIPVLAVYVLWARNARSDTVRQVGWIAGASQALAVVVAIFSFLLSWLALALAGVFAVIALIFLFGERG